MSVKITFRDRDLGYFVDLEIPEGLRDMGEIKEFISICNLSRAGRRSAMRAARRQYKDFGDVVWDLDVEKDEIANANAVIDRQVEEDNDDTRHRK